MVARVHVKLAGRVAVLNAVDGPAPQLLLLATARILHVHSLASVRLALLTRSGATIISSRVVRHEHVGLDARRFVDLNAALTYCSS